jgi:cytochrome c(L)
MEQYVAIQFANRRPIRVRASAQIMMAATLLGALLGVTLRAGAEGPLKNPYTGNQQAIEEGHQLFLSTGCYSCHGHEATGGVGPNLTGESWIYKPTDETLFRTIRNGREGTNMAGWSDTLSSDEIWKIIAFIRSIYKCDPSKIVW